MYDEEIVADSEGEDDLFGPSRAVLDGPRSTTSNVLAASTSNLADMSAISEFSASKYTAGDAIYNFSNPSVVPISNARAASTTSTIINSNTATSSRPRPKPKPKTVRTAAPGNISEKTSSSTSNIEMFDMTLSIADRAKMRKRNSDIQTSSFSVVPAYSPEIIELSSDDELSLRPANKPKKTTMEKKAIKKPSSTATADFSIICFTHGRHFPCSSSEWRKKPSFLNTPSF